ncbi:MAG: hypothetical protein O3A90_06365 [Proteobacteria bacterium]|nr:hypothetical protein [Pseudomonadota bacterium]MDA0850948.1 hypothetical protein [Pseudomonadota bacterium]MDA1295316.1 hypothetical protein [Pseudomonadota bacterium]
MKQIGFVLLTFLLSTTSLTAEGTQPSCPNNGADPSTFCPYGTVWSEKDKKCVGMV